MPSVRKAEPTRLAKLVSYSVIILLLPWMCFLVVAWAWVHWNAYSAFYNRQMLQRTGVRAQGVISTLSVERYSGTLGWYSTSFPGDARSSTFRHLAETCSWKHCWGKISYVFQFAGHSYRNEQLSTAREVAHLYTGELVGVLVDVRDPSKSQLADYVNRKGLFGILCLDLVAAVLALSRLRQRFRKKRAKRSRRQATRAALAEPRSARPSWRRG